MAASGHSIVALRITPAESARGVKAYYEQEQERADYYRAGLDGNGTWGGKGAEMLGLGGSVTGKAFNRLADNLHPREDKSLTVRNKENRRVGYDFNFHVPKSASIQALITGDVRITRAFREVVGETLKAIESAAATRVRIGPDSASNRRSDHWKFSLCPFHPSDGAAH